MAQLVTLLGPQRLEPNLYEAVAAAGVSGQIATVTAGWEEREGEDEELAAHLQQPTVNLRLYPRAEQIFEIDRELFDGHRAARDEVREIELLYRARLAHALEAARELLALRATERVPESSIEPEIEASIEAVRVLDEQFLARVDSIWGEYVERFKPAGRQELARQREELHQILADTAALCVAGGHVGVLLDRLQMFGVFDAFTDRPVFAWSAGAMALAERVVVFHDSPPQGPGNAEVFGRGVNVYRDVVPLPHAQKRLRLSDAARVELFARRFAPARCVLLDQGAWVEWDGETWTDRRAAGELCVDGSVTGAAQ